MNNSSLPRKLGALRRWWQITKAITAIISYLFLEPFSGSYWLAQATYYEARGESLRGQLAVVNVILNRTESPHFPNDISEVVDDGRERGTSCDFSYRCDKEPNTPFWHSIANNEFGTWVWIRLQSWVYYLLHNSLGLFDVTKSATYYKKTTVVSSYFSRLIQSGVLTKTVTIEQHTFYFFSPAR